MGIPPVGKLIPQVYPQFSHFTVTCRNGGGVGTYL